MYHVKKTGAIGYAGALLALIGALVPFLAYTIPETYRKYYTTNEVPSTLPQLGMDWAQVITILSAIVIILMITNNLLFNYVPAYAKSGFGRFMQKITPAYTLIPASYILLMMIIALSNVSSIFDTASAHMFVSYGPSLWLIVVGLVLIVANFVISKIKIAEPAKKKTSKKVEAVIPKAE